MDRKDIPQQYISTPYSYLKLANTSSLLQMRLLLKVANHIQSYMKDFFYSDRVKDKKNPLPLLSDLEKMKGIPQLRVSYAELGISTNNYAQSIVELDKITDLKVPKFSIKNGRFTTEKFWVFTKTESVMGDNFATLKINMDVVDEIFNMAEGYVTHPDDIALLAKVEKMPVLYFLLKRKMRNWKINAAKFNYNELKEALGLITKDIYGTVISEKYERFAAFKKRVIEASLKDLDRLVARNKIDKSFTVEYDYNGHKPVGEPMYIIFRTKEKPKEEPKAIELKDEPKAATKGKKPKAQQTELQFTDEEPQQEVKPSGASWQDIFREEGNKKWVSLAGHYEGRAKELLAQMHFHGKKEEGLHGNTLFLTCTKETNKALQELKLTEEEWTEIYGHIRKHKIIQNPFGDIQVIFITD